VLSSTANGQLQSQHEYKNNNSIETTHNKTNKKQQKQQQKKENWISYGFYSQT
jgi:hypothetical protein